jgi:hypothetical protein
MFYIDAYGGRTTVSTSRPSSELHATSFAKVNGNFCLRNFGVQYPETSSDLIDLTYERR